MKTLPQFLTLLFLLQSSFLIAQQNLPLIHANSKDAVIYEGRYERPIGWYLTPEAKPDVYTVGKNPKATRLSLHTDLDSITVKLKPGEHFDFIVLLNGKDSCYTRLQSPPNITTYAKQAISEHDTIPFFLTDYNNIVIECVLNDTDTLQLKFDSGDSDGSELHLTYDAIAEKTQLLEGQDKEDTNNYHQLGDLNKVQIGALQWDSLYITPSRLSGQGTDGRFGWGFFDGRIIEIDYDNKHFIVHSSLDKIPKGYRKYKLGYELGYLLLRGKIVVGGKKYKNDFLMDSGYQRTMLLDSVRMLAQDFPRDLPVIKTNSLRDGRGRVFVTKIIESDALKLGSLELSQVPTQLLSLPNPAGLPLHFMGNEILKRFNTIYDFQRNRMYLQPNSLQDLPYADAS